MAMTIVGTIVLPGEQVYRGNCYVCGIILEDKEMNLRPSGPLTCYGTCPMCGSDAVLCEPYTPKGKK